jgi:hypothetical protein
MITSSIEATSETTQTLLGKQLQKIKEQTRFSGVTVQDRREWTYFVSIMDWNQGEKFQWQIRGKVRRIAALMQTE